MFENKLMLGVMAGLVATTVKDIISQIFFGFKMLNYVFSQYASGVFVAKNLACSLGGMIIGYFFDFFVSALLGIIFIPIIQMAKGKYPIIIGIGCGILAWIGVYGALITMGVTNVRERPISDMVIMFFIHIIYGFVLGWFVKRFGQTTLKNTWKRS